MLDEIKNSAYSVSASLTNTVPTFVANTISTNVTSMMSTNSYGKKVKYKIDCYILHTVLLVIILFIIAVIYYHYTKHRSNQK